MRETPEGTAVLLREGCRQLFVVYPGFLGMVGKMSATSFLGATGLLQRNVVILRDRNNAGFAEGVSEELPDWESLVAWQRAMRRDLSEVDEVFLIGNSSGGFAALEAASALDAAGVWALAPRPPARGAAYRMAVRMLTSEPIDSEEDSLENIDVPRLERACVELARDPRPAGSLRVLYNPADRTDAEIAARLAACPGVALREVPSAPEAEGVWSHLVVEHLERRGELGDLLPPYRGSGDPRA